MKLQMKVQDGPRTHDHLLELSRLARDGVGPDKLQFVLDSEQQEADWAEVSPGVYSILIGGRSYEAQLTRSAGDPRGQSGAYTVTVAHRRYRVEVRDPQLRRYTSAAAGPEGPQEILAPMPGRVVKVLVSENQQVKGGAGLLVIEAMKMQNELRAPRSGRVERIYVREGTGVESGFKLLRLV